MEFICNLCFVDCDFRRFAAVHQPIRSSLGTTPGLETEWVGDPTAVYYLVVPMGPQGQLGEVGHYGL